MKNHSVATSVPLPSHKGITSNSTYQHIQGRSISAVISATSHAAMLVVSRYTCGSILEKNPLHAISATSLADIKTVWSITDFHTLVRNPLLVRSAITHAGSLVCWRDTWKSILLRLSHQHQHWVSIYSTSCNIDLTFWYLFGFMTK